MVEADAPTHLSILYIHRVISDLEEDADDVDEGDVISGVLSAVLKDRIGSSHRLVVRRAHHHELDSNS